MTAVLWGFIQVRLLQAMLVLEDSWLEVQAWYDEKQFCGYGHEARVAGDSTETQLTLTRLPVDVG